MSKLDEIMVESQNRIDNAGEAGWTGGFEYRFYEEWLKGEIKALILGLIGSEKLAGKTDPVEKLKILGRNDLRMELRQKVEEL